MLTPTTPHPRALPTLLEALALWYQAPVHAVLCATEEASWCRLGLLDDLLLSARYGPLHGRGSRAGGASPASASPGSVTSTICASSRSEVCDEDHARARGRDRAPALRRALAGRHDRDAARGPRRSSATRARRSTRHARRRRCGRASSTRTGRSSTSSFGGIRSCARRGCTTWSRERGYPGSVRTLREHVARCGPGRAREAYLMTETLPGEQAQVDWAYVGKLAVPGGERALWLFVMVLAYSRAMWGEFVHRPDRPLAVPLARARGARTSAACRGSGCSTIPRPSCSSASATRGAVPSRRCSRLCAAMRVEPKLCAVRKPEQKGKVERAIRYLRDRFLAGRTITGVDEGNRAARCNSSPRSRTSGRIRRSRSAPSARCSPTSARGCSRCPSRCPRPTRVEPIAVDSTGVRARRHQSLLGAERPRARKSSRSSSTIAPCASSTATERRRRARALVGTPPGHRGARASRRAARASAAPPATSRAATGSAPSSPASTASSSAGTSPARSLGCRVARAIKLLDLYGDRRVRRRRRRDPSRAALSDVGALAVACEKRRKRPTRPVPDRRSCCPTTSTTRDVIPHDLESYDE